MLGASYFRVIGAGEVYMAYLRGTAIDTALLHLVKSFPAFREFLD